MDSESTTPLLDAIADPSQVGNLTDSQLQQLADELRRRIIEVVARNGGHLAPSLGVVELTLALLATFDMSRDKLVWDVGHQSYAYKLLTGRHAAFDSLRKLGGISGFPRREESPYDHFGVGHSSTSISAALGMAVARDYLHQKHHVLAVIGDGSLTGGEAFEGLNLAGHMGRRLIVVLNDNEISISPNVGALSRFLSRTLSRRWVRQVRKDVLAFLRTVPRIGNHLATYAMRGEWSVKSFFTPGMLFEALRFTYIGPVDGHDLTALRTHLQMAAGVEDGPVLLHVRTRKGKGYTPAELDPTHYHGVGHFLPETGKAVPSATVSAPSYTSVFGKTLVALAEKDKRIMAITAAMPEGTGTQTFQNRFPDRFADVGICEQHAVTFAAGMASQGLRPVVAIYSTFLQRAYDQIVHDVCLQNLPVTFCIDRAGLVGEDGATHHGVFDMAYLRPIPNMHLLAPRDENALRHCLLTALSLDGPSALRIPRGAGVGVALEGEPALLPVGQGECLRQGKDAVLIAVGSCVHPALQAAETLAAEGIAVEVFDAVWIKPLPEAQLLELAERFSVLVLVEEGVRAGGFSSAVLELLSDREALRGQRVRRLGLGDAFVEHGTQAELRRMVGLDADHLAQAVREALQE